MGLFALELGATPQRIKQNMKSGGRVTFRSDMLIDSMALVV